MKLYTNISVFAASLLGVFVLLGCSSTQSLQEYYVDNSENPNFLAIDVPANILKLDEADLDETQRTALKSLRKLNILVFQKTTENAKEYKAETAKVKEILKNSDFKDLMKLNTPYARGVVKYSGDGDAIDEVVIYGDSQDKGFGLIRVLGDDMNPAHFMQLMQAIQKADVDGDGFKELMGMLKG
ncbi:MAG: DUF4252 domain-containing protein [Robiginitalea sp.]|nr:DUF4252 domain-containing protein [Robiginitalea sp.]